MDLEKVVKALSEIKTYCNANYLVELDYAIKVIEKLNNDGVKKPLETDFSSVAASAEGGQK